MVFRVRLIVLSKSEVEICRTSSMPAHPPIFAVVKSYTPWRILVIHSSMSSKARQHSRKISIQHRRISQISIHPTKSTRFVPYDSI